MSTGLTVLVLKKHPNHPKKLGILYNIFDKEYYACDTPWFYTWVISKRAAYIVPSLKVLGAILKGIPALLVKDEKERFLFDPMESKRVSLRYILDRKVFYFERQGFLCTRPEDFEKGIFLRSDPRHKDVLSFENKQVNASNMMLHEIITTLGRILS